MHEVNLQIRGGLARLRMQFCGASPGEAIQELFDGATKGRIPASFASVAPDCPLLVEVQTHNGPAVVPQLSTIHSLFLSEKELPLTQVFEELQKTGEESPIRKLWHECKLKDVSVKGWNPIQGGHGFTLRVHGVLPLKPQPMAPKETRITIVYHLTEPTDGTIVITEKSKTFDVPYCDSFFVVGRTRITLRENNSAGKSVFAEKLIGIDWVGRCMVKGIIERNVKSEGVENFKCVMGFVTDGLKGLGVPKLDGP